MRSTGIKLTDSQDYQFPKDLNAPKELKQCILDIKAESLINDIAKTYRLSKIELRVYTQLCLDYLFAFHNNSTGFIHKLESKSGIIHEKAQILAQAFKVKIIDGVIKLLKNYNIDLSNGKENVLFEHEILKITDRFIYYSEYKQRQPIINVSNIVAHKKFLSANYIIYFEVFIPKEGSWGSIDRPSFVLEKENAMQCVDKLEKAISLGEFRLMYENIMSYY